MSLPTASILRRPPPIWWKFHLYGLSGASDAEPTTPTKKAVSAATHFSGPERKFIGRQMQKHRSTWRGNMHQPTDFFREFGYGLIPKMSPWHSCPERAAKSKWPHTFRVPKFPWKEKSMDERFPVQVILQDQLRSILNIQLGPQTYWSFPKAPHVIQVHKVLNLFPYPFFSLRLWLPVCLKIPSHELHQNQFQSFLEST